MGGPTSNGVRAFRGHEFLESYRVMVANQRGSPHFSGIPGSDPGVGFWGSDPGSVPGRPGTRSRKGPKTRRNLSGFEPGFARNER